MPKRELQLSPSARALMLALVMAMFLVVSLGLAWWFSLSRRPPAPLTLTPTQAGELELSLPQNWTPQPDLAPPILHQPLGLAEPDQLHRRLIAGRLPDGPLRSPSLVANHALGLVLANLEPGALRRTTPQRLRLDHAVAEFSMILTSGGQKHFLAVLTLDGRRYWIIDLAGSLQAPLEDLRQVNQELQQDRQLFESILASANLKAALPVDSPDYQAAGLTGAPHPNLAAWRNPSIPSVPVVYFRPTQAGPALQWARVCVTEDIYAPDDNDPLSPAMILARRYQSLHDKPPTAQELGVGRINNLPFHRLLLDTQESNQIFRHVWLIRLPQRRVMLVELTGEFAASRELATVLPALLASFAQPPAETAPPPATAAAPPPSVPLAELAQRGSTLVRKQLQLLAQNAAAQPQPYVQETDGSPVGWELVKRALHNDEPRIRLSSLGALGGTLLFKNTAALATDGSAFHLEVALQELDDQGQPSAAALQRLEFTDQKLSFTVEPAQPDRNWTIPGLQPLLAPVADLFWPIDALPSAQPCLIWMSVGSLRPLPCLITADAPPAASTAPAPPPTSPPAPATPAQASEVQSLWVVQVQPLLCQDISRYWLDSKGTVVRYEMLWNPNGRFGDRWHTTRLTTSQELQQAFPNTSRAILRAQEELTSHD
ncbi:MAG: hypothetical protein IT443_13510 [Phycisphaeraceae bacterium]|nr:hypothetical protein [Phycisphaeraceae bacterium]